MIRNQISRYRNILDRWRIKKCQTFREIQTSFKENVTISQGRRRRRFRGAQRPLKLSQIWVFLWRKLQILTLFTKKMQNFFFRSRFSLKKFSKFFTKKLSNFLLRNFLRKFKTKICVSTVGPERKARPATPLLVSDSTINQIPKKLRKLIEFRNVKISKRHQIKFSAKNKRKKKQIMHPKKKKGIWPRIQKKSKTLEASKAEKIFRPKIKIKKKPEKSEKNQKLK